MRFIKPEFFYLVPVVVIFVTVLALSAEHRRKKQLKTLLGSRAGDPDAVKLSRPRRAIRTFLLLLSMLLLIAAAARPFWSSRLLPGFAKGRDLIVLFDVSKSMLSTDLAPSRFEHARYLLRELLAKNGGDRFGLVPFAGNAFLLSPLTADTVALEEYVKELSAESVPLGGTNIERAINVADKAFEAADGSNRAIILFTDGDELSGNSLQAAAQLKKQHIPLFIIGLGDPAAAAPVPELDGTLKRDRNNQLVTSRLNEPVLKKIAAETGGIYVRSTVADTGLEAIQRRISALGSAELGKVKRTMPIEKFPLALAGAMIALLGYMLLSERPGCGFRKNALFLALFPLLLGAAPVKTPIPAEKSEAGKNQPEVQISPALPESPDALYNLAREHQLAGQADSVQLYEKVLKKTPDQFELQSRSLCNLGVGLHTALRQQLKQAEEKLSAQQPDQASSLLEKTLKLADGAAELYRQSLSLPAAAAEVGGNLQRLSGDRRKIEDLKKKIEDLKKQQQEAKDKTKQAQQQQRKQQRKNSPEQQKKTQQSIDQAKQAAEKLQQKAEELKQQKLSDQAKNAAEELKQAEKSAAENKPQETGKHLDNAAKALGADKSKPESKQSQQKSTPPQTQPEQPSTGNPQESGRTAPPKPGKLDPSSAKQMLNLMAEEEQNRREQLKRQHNSRQVKVEKDW